MGGALSCGKSLTGRMLWLQQSSDGYNSPSDTELAKTVSEQTRACLLGALVNYPSINAGRSRSLFTTFQPSGWGTQSTSAQRPTFP